MNDILHKIEERRDQERAEKVGAILIASVFVVGVIVGAILKTII